MEKYFFMKPVLQLISVGHFFRKAFAIFLQILAVVIAIAGLASWVGVWKSCCGARRFINIGNYYFPVIFCYSCLHGGPYYIYSRR